MVSATIIYFDGTCVFCRRTVRGLRDLLLIRAELREAQSDPDIEALMRTRNSWIVQDPAAELHSGFDAFVALSRQSALLRWFAPVLGWEPVRWLGERGYRWVADHRSGLSRLLGLRRKKSC
jgi:predicted DCC family thiol-disulfide oxidoreductase YuxK